MLLPGRIGRRAATPAHVFMASGLLLLGVFWRSVRYVCPLSRWRAVGKVQLFNRRQSLHIGRGRQGEGGLVCSSHGRESAAEKKETWVWHNRKVSCTPISRCTRIWQEISQGAGGLLLAVPDARARLGGEGRRGGPRGVPSGEAARGVQGDGRDGDEERDDDGRGLDGYDEEEDEEQTRSALPLKSETDLATYRRSKFSRRNGALEG